MRVEGRWYVPFALPILPMRSESKTGEKLDNDGEVFLGSNGGGCCLSSSTAHAIIYTCYSKDQVQPERVILSVLVLRFY